MFDLTPNNDSSPAPFGANAPNAARATIIALAQRTRLKRGVFRPWLSRLVNLMRAGPVDVVYQSASFRFHHQNSATERGALFNPDYNLEELDFPRQHTPAGGAFIDVGAHVGTFALWPRAVAIEHLSQKEWREDCIADMVTRGFAVTRRTRSNTLLLRG